MPSKVRWRPDEPGRDPLYRKLYDRLAVQDETISWLLIELRKLQERVDKLEKPSNAALRKLARDNVEAATRMDKCSLL